MVKWVKNLTAAAWVAAETWVQSPAWRGGLKDAGLLQQCGLDSISSPGTSMGHE